MNARHWLALAALSLTLAGCSSGPTIPVISTPLSLLTLTPEAPMPSDTTRTATAGQAVTIALPVTAKELHTVRVPARVSATEVAYVKDLQWVDTPDRLFQELLAETVRRTTGRVVLDPQQAALDPGVVVTGELFQFGYDAAAQAVVIRFDGALTTHGGAQVEIRRFEARVPASDDAATVGPALNQAANQVALEAASWIGR